MIIQMINCATGRNIKGKVDFYFMEGACAQ